MLKNNDLDSEKSLSREFEQREGDVERDAASYFGEGSHLTASRPHIEISEKRATFCKASYEICFSCKFLLLMRGLKPKKLLKTIG